MKPVFTISILVCAGLLALLFGLSLSCSKRNRVGYAPISALRTVSSAQELYNTKYGTYGTLAQLDAANMIDRILANATTPASAKSGAYFIMRVSEESWCCGMRAAEWGVTGNRSFRISQDGVIYYSEKDEDMTKTTSGTALGG